MQHRSLHERGFTLLEVLVTLVVLGLLIVTLTQGIRAGMQAWALGDRMDRGADELETTDRTLRQLIERASPGEIRSALNPMVGGAHSLSFVTTLPKGLGARMTDEADVELLVGSGHRLELLWRPHYRRWIVPPPAPSAVTLLDNVALLSVSYWQPMPAAQRGRWLSAWTERQLPALVRLHIAFLRGSGQNWADIVVAPMCDVAPP